METQPQPIPLGDKDARALVATSLLMNGKLNDNFLPPAQFMIFKTKPFQEWPKELQENLRPFGASMIRDEPTPDSPHAKPDGQ